MGIADRWATWIVVIALLSALLTWIFTGEIIRSVTILVVFCPCALVLATPTAIMAAIGNSTRHGFLVREGDALERLAKVSYVAFDKTGTLTLGTPQVVAVRSFQEPISPETLFSWAASAEQRSEHPLGKAVVSCFKQKYGKKLPDPHSFSMIPGRGVKAEIIDSDRILAITAGNREMFQDEQISLSDAICQAADSYIKEGCTLIFVAADGQAAGLIALSDTLRPDAAKTIRGVKSAGLSPILLTGDHESAARHIADTLSIKELRWNCLPEDKLNWIGKSQKNGQMVCMIGDGVNDAPALKKAYVGIAMGGIGSDIAVDAADIALVGDEINELPHLLLLARRMMVTIKCNLTFSMTLNFIAIVLAITGILNPIVGALVHNAGSVLVIVNSAFLLKWKKHME